MPKLKPVSVLDYNKKMNGVDVLDQNISYYPVTRRSQKWTFKFMLYCFQISLFNAFLLFKAQNPESEMKQKQFIRTVATTWASPRRVNPRGPMGTGPMSRLSANIHPLPTKHELIRLNPTAGNPTPAKRCKVCSANGMRSETRFKCGVCCIPLHKEPCFTLFHTEENYAKWRLSI